MIFFYIWLKGKLMCENGKNTEERTPLLTLFVCRRSDSEKLMRKKTTLAQKDASPTGCRPSQPSGRDSFGSG